MIPTTDARTVTFTRVPYELPLGTAQSVSTSPLYTVVIDGRRLWYTPTHWLGIYTYNRNAHDQVTTDEPGHPAELIFTHKMKRQGMPGPSGWSFVRNGVTWYWNPVQNAYSRSPAPEPPDDPTKPTYIPVIPPLHAGQNGYDPTAPGFTDWGYIYENDPRKRLRGVAVNAESYASQYRGVIVVAAAAAAGFAGAYVQGANVAPGAAAEEGGVGLSQGEALGAAGDFAEESAIGDAVSITNQPSLWEQFTSALPGAGAKAVASTAVTAGASALKGSGGKSNPARSGSSGGSIYYVADGGGTSSKGSTAALAISVGALMGLLLLFMLKG
jgi:hypothetical protein